MHSYKKHLVDGTHRCRKMNDRLCSHADLALLVCCLELGIIESELPQYFEACSTLYHKLKHSEQACGNPRRIQKIVSLQCIFSLSNGTEWYYSVHA